MVDRTDRQTDICNSRVAFATEKSLEKLEKFHKLGQYYEYFPSFGGQNRVPPYKKKFSADLHELGHEK